MNCPKCGCVDRVMRTINQGNVTKRLRRCPKCSHVIETEEKQLMPPARIEAERKRSSIPAAKVRPIEELEDADLDADLDVEPETREDNKMGSKKAAKKQPEKKTAAKPKGALAAAMGDVDD